MRGVSNGKINLAQAEAIRDLIAAQTDAAVKQAARQLDGELSNALAPFKEKLVEVIVLLESAVEFVEEDIPALRAIVGIVPTGQLDCLFQAQSCRCLLCVRLAYCQRQQCGRQN